MVMPDCEVGKVLEELAETFNNMAERWRDEEAEYAMKVENAVTDGHFGLAAEYAAWLAYCRGMAHAYKNAADITRYRLGELREG